MDQPFEDLVAGSALMRGISAAATARLRRERLTVLSLKAGDTIFSEGDAADAVYLLLGAEQGGDGLDVDPLVQVELRPEANARVLRFDRNVHGEIFGELEFLEQGLSPVSVKRRTSAFALTPASVVRLPLQLLSDLAAEDEKLRARLIRIGSRRLLSTLTQLHEKARMFPDLVLADWLVELSADIGIAEGNRVRFPRKVSQSDIAADLGVSRETISRRLNEWERSGLLQSGARRQQIEITDYQRVSRLASLRTARSRAALDRTIDDIDAAIACGDLVRARNIGLDVLRYFPSSPELHHRTALAAARSGDAKGALSLLERSGLPMNGSLGALEDTVEKAHRNPFFPMDRILSEPFVDDGFPEDEAETGRGSVWLSQLVEDIAALHARLLKEYAFSARTAADRRKRARTAFEAYNRLFEARQGYYPGVNAASMALCAGDGSTAGKIAATLTETLSETSDDYWPLATLAEALVLVGRGDEAKDVLRKARDARGADDGAKASTILQFHRIGTVADTKMGVLADALAPRNVAVISGHMFRGSELDAEAQDETEEAIAARAEKLFERHNVGFAYGALACGSDIILAETALKMGAEFEAVLPFNTESFVEMSVAVGDPAEQAGKWEKRFRAILDGTHGACTLTVMDPYDPVERNLDSYFYFGFRYAAGCALQRAALLQTACGLIVVSDETKPDNIAGTNRAFADWRAHDRPFDVIPYPHTRPARPRVTETAFRTAFRPVVFLWDGAPGGSAATLGKLLKRAGKAFDAVERTHRDGRRGLCLVAETTAQAFEMAQAAVETARKARHPLRVICDFGLILGRNGKPAKKFVARLQAADDLPGLPLDTVLATESYAAQAKFDAGKNVALVPVGRAEPVPASEEKESRAMRNRPSLPVFTVGLRKPGTHP